jgi:hypothetical protein
MRKSPTRASVLQHLGEEPRGVLHEDRVGGVQFREGLLVLALDHDLRLGRHGGAGHVDEVLEPQAALPLGQFDGNARDRALRMRRGQLVARRRACSLSSSEQGQVEE